MKSFEHEVLHAVDGEPRAHGRSIREHIARRTGTTPSVAAVFVTLDRLAQRGLVSSRRTEAIVRHYTATDRGRRMLRALPDR